jgi:hypothetical protein
MLPGPCFVLSDAHLGAAPADVERTLVALLERARVEAKSVVLNGDVFDFWFEWRHVMPRVGFRVIAALAALRDDGVAVVWIAGNHDCWGGDILRNDVGLTYHVGPWRGEIAGWHTLIEHRIAACELCSGIHSRSVRSAGCIRTGQRGLPTALRTRVATSAHATAAPDYSRWRWRDWPRIRRSTFMCLDIPTRRRWGAPSPAAACTPTPARFSTHRLFCA